MDFRSALVAKADRRQQDLAAVGVVLNHEAVRDEFAGFADLEKVEAAITNLDDETLRELGDKARQVSGDVAAEGKTTVAIILVVALIIVSIVVNLLPKELD